MFDWNDLRHLLAVARAGTTLGAARELGASQPTVVRRIAALEAATGVNLFNRAPTGYVLTEAGRALLPLAERVEADVRALEDALSGRRRAQPGVLRLTVPELLNDFLFPVLCEFQQRRPEIQVQLLLADHRLNILRGEADLALRSGDTPEEAELFTRRMPDGGWTVYASRAYAARNGLPSTPAELNGHRLIGGEGYVSRVMAMQWLVRTAPDAPIVLRCNSLANVQAAIRAGLGVSVLPCTAGGSDAELVACFAPLPELARPLWLITRHELRRLSHVGDLLDAITAYMKAHEPLICGGEPPTALAGEEVFSLAP